MKKFTIIAAILCSALYSGTNFAIENTVGKAPEMTWFKNEMQCNGTKINVRSLCMDDHTNYSNTFCSQQHILLTGINGITIKKNLLEKEPYQKNFHTAQSLTCVKTKNASYLYVHLSNGGNCNGCENDGLMDLRGQWIRYGNRWMNKIPEAEKKDISRYDDVWWRQDGFYLENKIAD